MNVRNIRLGIYGGLAGGVVFGAMMGMMGMLPMIGKMAGHHGSGVTSPFESRGARDGVPSEERATA